MKRNLKNIIIVSILFIMIFNVLFPTIASAVDADSILNEFDGVANSTLNVLDGIVGILIWIPRALFSVNMYIVQVLMSRVFGDSGIGDVLTPEDIIFSGASGGMNLININFFDFSSNNSLINSFRRNVAKWYFALRNLAIVISLAVLIYIGIRMAISSVAQDKAMYKKMLTDWLLGFLVLFFLHYIILIILNLNNALVSLIYNMMGDSGNGVIREWTTEMFNQTFNISFIKGIGAVLIYVCLIFSSLRMMYVYMKRLFTVGFLIVISPLITITYSIDKIGDGKSQALDTWFKEFAYNVLIQPFHCIIYAVFVSAAVGALQVNGTIANLAFAIIAVLFIDKAEDIVRNIFGFSKAKSLEGAVAAGALVASTLSKVNGLRKNKDGASQKTSNTVHRKQVPNSQNGGMPAGNATTPGGNATTPAGNTTTTEGNTTTSAGNTTTAEGNTTTSTGNGSTPNVQTGSALGRAMSDYKNKIGDKLREIKNDPVGNLSNAAKNIPIRALAASANVLPRAMVGAAVTGLTGNVITGFAAGSAYKGTKFTRSIGKAAKEDSFENKQYNQDKILASAYESYKMANSDMSDEELYNKSIDLLKANPNRLTDENEIALAKALQATQDNYINAGYEDYKVKTMNKLEDIQNGAVKSSIDIRAGKVIEAAKQYRNSTPGMSNNDVIVESKEIMESIDNYNGSNYLKSDEYNNLGDEKKKLAKEIHKSKKLISSIGEHSNDEINKEIERRINNDLI